MRARIIVGVLAATLVGAACLIEAQTGGKVVTVTLTAEDVALIEWDIAQRAADPAALGTERPRETVESVVRDAVRADLLRLRREYKERTRADIVTDVTSDLSDAEVLELRKLIDAQKAKRRP